MPEDRSHRRGRGYYYCRGGSAVGLPASHRTIRSPEAETASGLFCCWRELREIGRPSVFPPTRRRAFPIPNPQSPIPSMSRIEIYDTTLRDGAQGEGVSFSLQDKLALTERLDRLGFDYIEGGYPASNEKDCEYFKRVGQLGTQTRQGLRLRHDAAQERPGGMRRRPAGIARRRHDHGYHLVGKASVFQATDVLRTTLRRKPGDDPRKRRLSGGRRTQGDFRRRAFLRRLEARRRVRPVGRPNRGRSRGPRR